MIDERQQNRTSEILWECGRVVDLKGEVLDLDRVHKTVYECKRYRESSGINCDIIDCFTAGKETRDWLMTTALNFLVKKFGMTAPVIYVAGPFLSRDEYSVPGLGVRLAVFNVHFKDSSPSLWLVDISDLTERGDVMTPKNHAAFVNFSGIKYHDP